ACTPTSDPGRQPIERRPQRPVARSVGVVMSYVLEKPGNAARPSTPRKALQRGRKRRQIPRVLLIDDDPAIRALCSVNLRALGIDVIEAPDGTQGFKLARREHPDLVLLDVSMPGLDGFQVGELVRRHRRTRKIPLVFLSGEAETDAPARELGAIACLEKPFDPQAL